MDFGRLPLLVIQNIVDNYLTCHDQLTFSHSLTEYLHINDRLLATILRSSYEIDLSYLSRAIIRNNSRYIEQEQSLSLRNTSISWPYLLPRSFDFNTLNKVWAYYRTDLFSLYARLFSYSPFVYRPKYTLVNIFKVPFIIQPDSLSFYEQSFFQLYGENPQISPEIVSNFEQFYSNLIQRFQFDKIAPFIDFNKFNLAGGSVLISMLQNAPEPISSDIDFFYIGPTFNNFIQSFTTVRQKLSNLYIVKKTILLKKRVYQLEVIFASTVAELLEQPNNRNKMILQFIYHPSMLYMQSYLMAFDLDIIQVSYNGKEVLSTWPFIRALNTGTFICYNLTNDLSTLGRSALRIAKYYQRNFRFLYPHDFQIESFLSLRINQSNYYSISNVQFGSNNDFFQLQKNLSIHLLTKLFK